MPAMSRFLRRVVLALVWLLIVAVISVGGAGLVAGLANQPGTAARAELTSETDTAAAAALDTAEADLTQLTADVARLGELGRGALTALVSSDFTTLDSAVADGQTLARKVESSSALLRDRLSALPGSGPHEALLWSPTTIERRDVALAAATATGGLEVAWARLAAGSTVAIRLGTLLTNHDKVAGQAAATGRAKKYAAALSTLATAQAMLDQANSLRDVLANAVDVSTLTQWIDRNAGYDAALARLYRATIAAKGKVSTTMIDAARAERNARDLLPSNTSGIVIILAEIGRGGLNEAVIGIEQARAKLQAALDQLAGPVGSASPGPDQPLPSG